MFYSLFKGSNRRLKRNAHTYTQEIKRDWVYCGQRKKRGERWCFSWCQMTKKTFEWSGKSLSNVVDNYLTLYEEMDDVMILLY